MREKADRKNFSRDHTLAGRPVNLQEYVEKMISWAGF